MNTWPNEAMAECHRWRIMEEVEQIRLERLAGKSRHRRRLFRGMTSNLGKWMISTGNRLSERYEVHEKEAVY
jgi:hypothetical protein